MSSGFLAYDPTPCDPATLSPVSSLPSNHSAYHLNNSSSNKGGDGRSFGRRRVLESEYDSSLNEHLLPKNKQEARRVRAFDNAVDVADPTSPHLFFAGNQSSPPKKVSSLSSKNLFVDPAMALEEEARVRAQQRELASAVKQQISEHEQNRILKREKSVMLEKSMLASPPKYGVSQIRSPSKNNVVHMEVEATKQEKARIEEEIAQRNARLKDMKQNERSQSKVTVFNDPVPDVSPSPSKRVYFNKQMQSFEENSPQGLVDAFLLNHRSMPEKDPEGYLLVRRHAPVTTGLYYNNNAPTKMNNNSSLSNGMNDNNGGARDKSFAVIDAIIKKSDVVPRTDSGRIDAKRKAVVKDIFKGDANQDGGYYDLYFNKKPSSNPSVEKISRSEEFSLKISPNVLARDNPPKGPSPIKAVGGHVGVKGGYAQKYMDKLKK